MSDPGISILCPTRGRPHNVDAMMSSVFGTAAKPHNVEVVLYLDDDDGTRSRTCEVIDDYLAFGHRVWVVEGPRIILSETWNRCAAAARHEVLAHSDDDVLYRTHGWDDLLRAAFETYPDRIAFVHGRDGIHDARFGSHGFIHRRWVDAVGYFVPPYFSSDWNDAWLNEVAEMLGRRHFIPELYTEHMHPAVGKAPLDRTYEERFVRHAADNVDALYASLAHERVADAEKLRRVMT